MSTKEIKVLFLCKKRLNEYGNSVGLVNSAQFIANYLNAHNIPSKVITVHDANGIDKEVHQYKPTHVVLHAIWVTAEKIDVLTKKYPAVKWQVRIHSKIPFLAHEGIAIEWIKKYQKLMLDRNNLDITFNSKEPIESFERAIRLNSIYLPNIYEINEVSQNCQKDNYNIHIGCFGAIRPFKNHVIQAMAAMAFGNETGKSISFHINAGRVEQNGESILKNLQNLFKHTPHTLVEHPWMDQKKFLELARNMDIGMQVSLSETYNIVTADMLSQGVLSVVSPEISWVPFFMQVDPQDMDSMVRKLKLLYYMPKFVYSLVYKLCKFCLWYSNKRDGKIWIKYLATKDV